MTNIFNVCHVLYRNRVNLQNTNHDYKIVSRTWAPAEIFLSLGKHEKCPSKEKKTPRWEFCVHIPGGGGRSAYYFPCGRPRARIQFQNI